VKLHDVAEYRNNKEEGGHILTTVGRIIYNDRIKRALGEAMGAGFDLTDYEFVQPVDEEARLHQVVDELVQKYGAASIAQVLDAFKDIGFRYATLAGITISKNDVVVPPDKEAILDRYQSRSTTSRSLRHRSHHAGGAPPVGHRQVAGGHRRGRPRDGGQPRSPEPHLHDGQLGRPRIVQADPAARRNARRHGQPEGRDHRASDQVQLPSRDCRCSSTSSRPTAPARDWPTRRCARPTRAT
jgi:hypothetical protein